LLPTAMIACTLLFTPVSRAQDATGRIAGNVTDQTGAVVPAAKVTATNTGTSVSKSITTDPQGYYQFLQLPIGRYEISAESLGFKRAVVQATNSLEINQTMRVDLTLQIGGVAETVTVESQGSIVETQNATVGGTVSGQAIFELPLNGRNTLDLLATQPGVTPTNPDSTAKGAYSIGGGRTDSVTYLLDGGNNNNLLTNAAVANPNPDAVAEFRVLESNYGAEYGRNAGGIVSIVTKSGTNSLHGTAYDYLRNNALDANNFFNNEQGIGRPVLKRNQFGGTIGGPIVFPKVFDGRNKLFFFFAYQGQRQSASLQNGKVTTFTPLEAQGDFSQSANGGPDPHVAAFLATNPYYQSDPSKAAQAIIDPSRIDPVAQAYFKAGLIPTSATGAVFPQGAAIDNIDEYLGKIDYNITSKDTLSATLTSRSYPQTQPFNANGLNAWSNVAGYPVTNSVNSYFGTVTYIHTFVPSLVNELRVTAQRSNNLQFFPAGQIHTTPQQLGIGITPDVASGPTLLGFQGKGLVTGYSPNGPTNEIDNTYALYDNMSWVKGKHSLKFGFYFSPYQDNTVYDYYTNGEFFFYGPNTSVGSKNDFADFVMGLPDEFLQFPSAPSNIRSRSYAGYGQDEWHIAKRLTLTLGLRYEYAQPKYDTQGRSFSIVPGQQSQRFVNAPTGLVFPGDPGAPKGSNFADKTDFAPRLGFAYDVFGNAKTSVRGGFGVFYDILKAEDNLQFNGQAPFFSFADVFFSPPNPTAGPTPNNYAQVFPASGSINPFPSKPPSKNIDFNAAGFLPFGGSSVYFVDPNLKTPYVYHYNFSLQQELASGLVLETGYVGYTAHGLTALVDNNPFVRGTNNRLLNLVPGGNFSYLDTFQNIGKASYNAWQSTLTKRYGGTDNSMFGGVFMTLAYTWAHQIDNVSGFRQRNSVVPYYDHNALKASGDTDVRQFMSLSGGWDIPFDKWVGGPKLLTKGWSLYPIVSYRTGFPLDVLAGLNTTRRDPGPAGDGQAGSIRADLVGALTIFDPKQFQSIANNNNNGTAVPGNYWFNPNAASGTRINALDALAKADASQLNGQFTYGTFPRNSLRGPGRFNIDFSISKHFALTERLNVELRADCFNLTNSVQFRNPDTNINDPQFGQISSTYDPRIIQVAMHLRF
jgi:outer membrane receptor protein involved in Fe transport